MRTSTPPPPSPFTGSDAGSLPREKTASYGRSPRRITAAVPPASSGFPTPLKGSRERDRPRHLARGGGGGNAGSCQPLPVQRTSPPPSVRVERLAQTKRTANRSMVSRCGRVAFGPTTPRRPPTLFICCDHDTNVYSRGATPSTSCDFPPRPGPLSDLLFLLLTPGSWRWGKINI